MTPSTYFLELGARIENAWRRHAFDERAFPDICCDALVAEPPCDAVSLESLLDASLSETRLPRQVDIDSNFGQPPLTVFAGAKFFISVLFWFESTTAIHEHAFSGAFSVLHGASVHSEYSFLSERHVNDYMEFGRIEQRKSEILRQGDCRPIRSRGGTIHSLFHLEHPSLTVVVRTYQDSFRRPQLTYLRPCVAFAEDYDADELRRRKQLVSVALRRNAARASEAVVHWCREADVVSRFELLRHTVSELPPSEGDALLRKAAELDHDLARRVAVVVEEHRRGIFLSNLRRTVLDADLRLFLAVLLNVHGRQRALELIRALAPGVDAVTQVLSWCRALGTIGEQTGTDARVFPADDFSLDVLGRVLHGDEDEELLSALGRSYGHELVAREDEAIRALTEAFRGSEAFRSILVE